MRIQLKAKAPSPFPIQTCQAFGLGIQLALKYQIQRDDWKFGASGGINSAFAASPFVSTSCRSGAAGTHDGCAWWYDGYAGSSRGVEGPW